jgi:membrane protein DedA with SNARE-associated domain
MSFIERMWAYITLGATGSFVGEASPLLGGVAAFDRDLNLISVINAVALGTWLGGLMFYALGRWQGDWIRGRWPKLRPYLLRSIKIVRRNPWRVSLAIRFAYGLRIALPIGCGVARLPLHVYAIGTGISAVVWSLIFTVLGWALGRTAETFLGHVKDFEGIIGVVLVTAMIVGYFVIRRKHIEDRTADILDRHKTPLGVSSLPPAEQLERENEADQAPRGQNP